MKPEIIHESKIEKLPFWYERDFRNLDDRLKSRPILVLGGRGFGKSTLLRHLWQKQCRRVGEASIEFVDGRDDNAKARSQIKDARPKEVVFIDDLDLIWSTAAANDTQESLEKLKVGLWNLLRLNQPRNENFSCVASACIDVGGPSYQRLVESIQDTSLRKTALQVYSIYVQNLETYKLEPWRQAWEFHWKDGFDRAFSRKLGEKDGVLMEIWRSSILGLTGGHPALFGPAIRRLEELCQQQKGTLPAFERQLVSFEEVKNPELPHRVRVYLEDHLSREAIRGIKSSVRRLKDSPNSLEQRAFELLLEIAHHGTVGVLPPTGATVRQLLLDEGLVYQDLDKVTGNFIVPGSMIREQIVQIGEAFRPALPKAHIKLEKVGLEDAGDVIVNSGSGSEVEKIRLSGTSWRLLEALYSRRNSTVSKQDLQQLVGLVDDDKAVLNAVQRLQRQLRIHQLSKRISITSEYGKGYRLALVDS